MPEENLVDAYPVRQGECLRIMISELHTEDGCELSVTCLGKPIPIYHAAGLLEQAKYDILNTASEEGGMYLEAD